MHWYGPSGIVNPALAILSVTAGRGLIMLRFDIMGLPGAENWYIFFCSNSRWRTSPKFDIVNCSNSAMYCSVLSKFGMSRVDAL